MGWLNGAQRQPRKDLRRAAVACRGIETPADSTADEGWWGLAGTGRAARLCRACPYHCASVPPVGKRTSVQRLLASRQIDRHEYAGVRTPTRGSTAGGPGLTGKSGRTSGRAVEQLLVKDRTKFATSNASNATNAWNVNLNNGNVNANNKTNTNYVWPVRGGE